LADEGKFHWSMHWNGDEENAASLDKMWDVNYEALMLYGKEFNTYNVPYHYTTTSPTGIPLRLGYWLHKQRRMRRLKTMPSSRLAKYVHTKLQQYIHRFQG
jgi:hypothetical protein